MSKHKSIALLFIGQHPNGVLDRLDFLHSAGEQFEEIYLLYIDDQINRRKSSYLTLLERLAEDVRWRHLPIVKKPIGVDSPENRSRPLTTDAAFLWQSINLLTTALKGEGNRLNIVVGEGEMVVGMLLMAAANLHFYPYDKLWQHAADGNFIQLPVTPLGSLFAGMQSLATYQYGQAAPDPSLEPNCRAVMRQLTRRQRDVLSEFAKGMRPGQVAENLSLSLATIDSHKAQIFKVVRDVWELEPDARLDFRFLHSTFSHFSYS